METKKTRRTGTTRKILKDKEDKYKEDKEDREMMRITMRTYDPSQRSQCPLKTCSRVFTKHQSIIG